MVLGCRYVWKGLDRLPRTIAQIRSEDFSSRGTGIGRAGERREKSLGLLSQRFVQIFVQSPDNSTVPLDTAAEMLLGEFGKICFCPAPGVTADLMPAIFISKHESNLQGREGTR